MTTSSMPSITTSTDAIVDAQAVVCPVCSSRSTTRMVDIPQAPAFCNVLHETRERALAAARGDIRLTCCDNCSHIFNAAFDATIVNYDAGYGNPLHFSGVFQAYAEDLALRLASRYSLDGKLIIDIGGGDGHFLSVLCAATGASGIGFDPSHDAERAYRIDGVDVRFIPDYYSDAYATYAADFACCRHVLEHVPDPRSFVPTIHQAVSANPAAAVLFEVPNGAYTLKRLAIWDLIYEHVSYFTPRSLTYLMTASGFDVLDLNAVYSGQFLAVEGRPAPVTHGNVLFPAADEDLHVSARRFSDSYRETIERWNDHLQQLARDGRRIVIWGAGSKGVTFLNVFRGHAGICYVVDINPHKHGKFVAGTGHEVVPASFLTEYQPDVVILMNPIYRDEVSRTLSELGVVARVMTT